MSKRAMKQSGMTAKEHTPGPWDYKEVALWTPDRPTDGIPHFVCAEHGGAEWLSRAKANARLIAAAPELLEALEAVVLMGSGDDSRVWEMADKAIAKAKGE